MTTLLLMLTIGLVGAFAFAPSYGESGGSSAPGTPVEANPILGTGLNVPGLRNELFQRMADVKTMYQDLSTRVPSDKSMEMYRWLGAVPQMRPWGNGRLPQGLSSFSYNVTNGKFESTVKVDRDEFDDDLTGQIKMRIMGMAPSAARHKDYLIGQLLENGATAGFVSYDNVPFFSTAHVYDPNQPAGSPQNTSQSNDQTYQCVNKAVPTADECVAMISSMIAQMATIKDDKGYPAVTDGDGYALIVPPKLEVPFRKAAQATIIAATTNVIEGIADVRRFAWLTSVDKVYLLKLNEFIRPIMFQDRKPLEFGAVVNPEDSYVFENDAFLFGLRARYSMVYGKWEYAQRMTLTQ